MEWIDKGSIKLLTGVGCIRGTYTDKLEVSQVIQSSVIVECTKIAIEILTQEMFQWDSNIKLKILLLDREVELNAPFGRQ